MFRPIFLMIALLAVFAPLKAMASDKVFFQNIQGKWSGPGEIVAGKYKGTKFTCVFDGLTQDKRTGMSIDGYCRVGMFSQPMNALIERAGKSYSGTFLDGEKGEGMDIIGGHFSTNRIVVDIKRNDLRGVMVARKSGADRMQFTISVRVDGRLVPVIGMALDRMDKAATPRVAIR